MIEVGYRLDQFSTSWSRGSATVSLSPAWPRMLNGSSASEFSDLADEGSGAKTEDNGFFRRNTDIGAGERARLVPALLGENGPSDNTRRGGANIEAEFTDRAVIVLGVFVLVSLAAAIDLLLRGDQ